ncbi:hypothetical protein V6Z12_D10G084200 [Gossypium hirsutum]
MVVATGVQVSSAFVLIVPMLMTMIALHLDV